MKNILLILLILIIIILSFLGLRKVNLNNNSTATINDKRFNLEIANTENEKAIGLAKYTNIEDDFAMYFPFSKKGYYNFWMKDMKFPIDILYLDNEKIVAIFKNVPDPKSANEKLNIYKPEKPANGVLELKAGISDKYQFKLGDSVKIKN